MITQNMDTFICCAVNQNVLTSSKNLRFKRKKRHGKHIQTLRSDRGGEYLSAEFIKYLSESGITSQYSAPGTPQQNGVAERRNRTLLEMVRSMLSYSDLPFSFWGYALETANYTLNLVPSKSVPLTPSELWTGRKPSLRHIRVWGCPAHVLKGKTDKLESRTEVCIFIGYPKGTKGGLFYCPKEQKVIVSTNAKFLEKDYLMNHVPRSKLLLQELNKGITNNSTLEQVPQTVVDMPLHPRSGRHVNR